MPETDRREFAFRVLRYAPNILRDEWVNIGVILEQFSPGRRKARLRAAVEPAAGAAGW
jgi:hypothetical protein